MSRFVMSAIAAVVVLVPAGQVAATEYLCFDSTTQWVLRRPIVTTPEICVPA